MFYSQTNHLATSFDPRVSKVSESFSTILLAQTIWTKTPNKKSDLKGQWGNFLDFIFICKTTQSFKSASFTGIISIPFLCVAVTTRDLHLRTRPLNTHWVWRSLEPQVIFPRYDQKYPTAIDRLSLFFIISQTEVYLVLVLQFELLTLHIRFLVWSLHKTQFSLLCPVFWDWSHLSKWGQWIRILVFLLDYFYSLYIY